MKRNPVQFWKGLGPTNFLSITETRTSAMTPCSECAGRTASPYPHCGHDRSRHLNARQLRQCYRCHRQTLVVAGTIFESGKLLLTRTRKGGSAMQLHRRPGVSCHAAWRIRHKLMQVMVGHAGCRYQVVASSGHAAVEQPEFHRASTTVPGNWKTALRSSCHSFRPKHAQRCLAEVDYRFNRRYACQTSFSDSLTPP